MPQPLREGAATDAIADILETQDKDTQARILKSLVARFAPHTAMGEYTRRSRDDDEDEDEEDDAPKGVAGCDSSDRLASGKKLKGEHLVYESSLGGSAAVDLGAFDRECDRVRNGFSASEGKRRRG